MLPVNVLRDRRLTLIFPNESRATTLINRVFIYWPPTLVIAIRVTLIAERK